jgi:hypothetical protein
MVVPMVEQMVDRMELMLVDLMVVNLVVNLAGLMVVY